MATNVRAPVQVTGSGKGQHALLRIAPELALAAGLVVSVVSMVVHARTLWFFGDDFDFLLNRSVSLDHDHGLLVPHNEHWSTIPILLFRLNYALFGLHHYLPYAVVPIALHVGVCALAFVLLRLCGTGRAVASAAALVLVFCAGGGGAENPLWDFQAGFLGSCALGMLAMVLLAGRRGAAWNAAAAVALVLALTSSGMGIVMVVWAVTFRFARDGVWAAARTAAAPLVVYAAWYLAYGRGHTGAPPADLSVAPLAAMHGLASVWSVATGMPGAGPVVLLLLVIAVLVPAHDPEVFALAVSGLLAAAVAYALLAYSRSGLGVDATVRSRYVYFGVVLMIPAVAAALTVLARGLAGRPVHVTVVATLVAVALLVGVGLAQEARWTANRRSIASDTKGRLVAAARLVESGAPLLGTLPMPERNPDVTVAALTKDVRAALPDVRPGRRADLYVAGRLQVAVSGTARGFGLPTTIRWQGFDRSSGPAAVPGVCETRTAVAGSVLEIPGTGSPTEFRLTVGGSRLTTALAQQDVLGPDVRWPTQPAVPVYVASSVSNGVTLRVLVPPGPTTVCPG